MHYTIKQMAQMFGVTEHTLRFYTGKGLLPCARDGGNPPGVRRGIRQLDAGHPVSEGLRRVH